MKILFFGHPHIHGEIEYGGDVIFHGLKSIPELEVYTYNEPWYVFKDARFNDSSINQSLYGKGFSITNLLDTKLKLPTPPNLVELIKDRYFDYVIYGSVYLLNMRGLPHLTDVIQWYPKDRIIFIDFDDLPRLPYPELLKCGHYFKRELREQYNNTTYPISIGIPSEKVCNSLPEKTKLFADLVPGDISTYVYNNEQTYYSDYKNSRFALTWKKGGWDCMRHVEILANRCIPYFDKSTFENCGLNIDNCPPLTMTNHRKDLYSWILKHQHRHGECIISNEKYQEIENILYQNTLQNLTTEAIAKYILTTVSI